MKPSILIVDDEPGVRNALSGVLRDEGYDVEAVSSGEDCLERVTRAAFDLVVLDVWLPGMDGLATLARLRERQIDAQIVLISGHGNIESAVRAIKLGAFDFVEKPLSLEKTVLVVRNALHQRHLEAENRALRARVDRTQTMVGESYAMRQLREQVAMAAPTNGRVLIYGENGTGKELVARTIHALSRRRVAAFVEVNCAAIPEELIESELFGHVRGAFTGAVADRRGKFEVADGGTIFLDEIGDMSLKTQAKVLRVLQEQTMEAVGGTARIKVDARVLAATNKDLQAEIRSGRFREDLYFRLNVIPIFVPPLRDRQEDIPLLGDHFMANLAREYGRRVKRFDAGARAVMQQYPWPGNVRELRNVIERLMIMVPGDSISPADLSFLDAPALSRPAAVEVTGERRTLHEARDQFERDLILRTLAEQQGNMSRTAEVLGVERSNLYRKMKAFGIAPSRRVDEEPEQV
ncbi:MAG: sigma-54-dependent Fis family transcriptional regulator [Acidobacteria bacterium]|nr:sigma-54-dependent Fis family transcriptional regulator [Acidobacteriota bacterium]